MASNSDVTIVGELEDMSEIDQKAASPASSAASESSINDKSVTVRNNFKVRGVLLGNCRLKDQRSS